MVYPAKPGLDDWRLPYPYRERPFGITDESDCQWVLDKITPQPIQTITEPIRLPNGGGVTIPRTYIYLRPPAGQPPETEFIWFAERARTQPDWKYSDPLIQADSKPIFRTIPNE